MRAQGGGAAKGSAHIMTMKERDLTRRGFVRQSLAAVGPAMVAANSLPLVPAQGQPDAARLAIVCVGGHPDDPESGCGGGGGGGAAPRDRGGGRYLPRGGRG